MIQAGVFNATNEAKVQKPKICYRMTNSNIHRLMKPLLFKIIKLLLNFPINASLSIKS